MIIKAKKVFAHLPPFRSHKVSYSHLPSRNVDGVQFKLFYKLLYYIYSQRNAGSRISIKSFSYYDDKKLNNNFAMTASIDCRLNNDRPAVTSLVTLTATCDVFQRLS